MSLSQVQKAWAEYPKGLEIEDGEDEEDEEDSSLPTSTERTKKFGLKNPALDRLAAPSGFSTPSSSSSSSLEPNTAATTPSSSDTSFTPIGIGRHTSQRASDLTESPLFVTWNTVSARSSNRSLRGCIGTFEPLPLEEGLSSYALTSAFSDHRFSPISLSELPSLEVAVTLLTDFETAKDPMDWELGVHGVRISFYNKNKRYGSCYLPDVAVEQGWDKEETMVSLMRKAGWGGRREKWMDVDNIKTVRFQGMAETVGYEEYRRWRDWVKSRDVKK
jgi:uncharacterized protein (TIGR00296 family)